MKSSTRGWRVFLIATRVNIQLNRTDHLMNSAILGINSSVTHNQCHNLFPYWKTLCVRPQRYTSYSLSLFLVSHRFSQRRISPTLLEFSEGRREICYAMSLTLSNKLWILWCCSSLQPSHIWFLNKLFSLDKRFFIIFVKLTMWASSSFIYC